jgi:hypothetical protein
MRTEWFSTKFHKFEKILTFGHATQEPVRP